MDNPFFISIIFQVYPRLWWRHPGRANGLEVSLNWHSNLFLASRTAIPLHEKLWWMNAEQIAGYKEIPPTNIKHILTRQILCINILNLQEHPLFNSGRREWFKTPYVLVSDDCYVTTLVQLENTS